MLYCKNKKPEIKSQRGMVTIPFLLVSMILIFLILSFLFLNMTLVHVSITQYMSYSTARKLFLASNSRGEQHQSTIDYYRDLRAKFFKPNTYTGRSGDWFAITSEIETTNLGDNVYGVYKQTNKARERFYGVNLGFKTFILKLKIPFLSQKSDRFLEARVSSFLGREPSKNECVDFMEKKYESLQIKCSSSDCPGIAKVDISTALPDNGC